MLTVTLEFEIFDNTFENILNRSSLINSTSGRSIFSKFSLPSLEFVLFASASDFESNLFVSNSNLSITS